MVRAAYPGVFATYKRLKDATRKAYWYHRATGQRLDGVPGSREFILIYAEAERSLIARHSGDTFNGLIRAYTTSPEFETKLSAGIQREYKRRLTKAKPEFGDMPREALNDPGVRKDLLDWRAKVARTSGERECDNRLSVISAMLSWAQENGRLPANHIRGFRRFARLWEQAANEVGLRQVMLPGLATPVSLHFHDLRGTAVAMLSEAGCNPQQIAAITGHSLKTVTVILDRYLARTRALADQAILNFETSPRTEFASRLQTVARSPDRPKIKIVV
ncbi:integrase [uncultured Methylobacterium sp.]|uniref:integrase n=1 Tax=uncultured Methylobacterium sp. TaxID=157278 RepID=UPI0035CA2CD8